MVPLTSSALTLTTTSPPRSRRTRAFLYPAPTLPLSTLPSVILGTISHIAQIESTDVSLSLVVPLRVSRLAISPHAFPIRPMPRNFLFMLAAEPSGLLLLSVVLDAPLTYVDVDRPDEQSFYWRYVDPCCFVLNAAMGSAFRFPDPVPKEPIQY